jgi:hypothetical protein
VTTSSGTGLAGMETRSMKIKSAGFVRSKPLCLALAPYSSRGADLN